MMLRALATRTNHRAAYKRIFIRYEHALKGKARGSSSSSIQNSSSSSSSASQGVFQLLNSTQREFLENQKLLLNRAREVIAKCGGEFHETSLFHESIESTFVLVVAGEFNSGKSTIINGLLGSKFMPSGPLPTTDSITILTSRSGELPASTIPAGMTVHTHSLPLLQDLSIIDTPGTNTASFFHHTEKTLRLLPSADLILFVTSAERPITQSEIQLIQYLQKYSKPMILIVNKMDILESLGEDYGAEEKKKVLDYVKQHFPSLKVMGISARDALNAKLLSEQPEYGSGGYMYNRSNFTSLEDYLIQTLTKDRLVQSKLLNPIGVMEGAVSETLEKKLKPRKKELDIDVNTLQLLHSQMQGWKHELLTDWEDSRKEILKVLEKEASRGKRVMQPLSFWEIMQLGFTWERFQDRWLLEDIDVRAVIDQTLKENIALITNKTRTQSHAIIEYLGKRPSVTSSKLVGSISSSSSSFRLEEIQNSFADKVDTTLQQHDFDNMKYARAMFQSLRITVISSTACYTGAITASSVGALHHDWALLGGGGILAIFSYFLASFRSKNMTNEYSSNISFVREKLISGLDEVSTREIDRIYKRLLDGVSPYTRYVQSETETVKYLTEECEALLMKGNALRNQIQQLDRE